MHDKTTPCFLFKRWCNTYPQRHVWKEQWYARWWDTCKVWLAAAGRQSVEGMLGATHGTMGSHPLNSPSAKQVLLPWLMHVPPCCFFVERPAYTTHVQMYKRSKFWLISVHHLYSSEWKKTSLAYIDPMLNLGIGPRYYPAEAWPHIVSRDSDHSSQKHMPRDSTHCQYILSVYKLTPNLWKPTSSESPLSWMKMKTAW